LKINLPNGRKIMSDQSWLSKLRQHRAIAVIRSSQMELAYEMAKAVAVGGMKLIEITWNSDRAGDLIKQLRTELPDCTIGTGTLLNMEDLENAIASGVEFIFTPHVNADIIRTANLQNIPVIPGALTPTEIVNAWNSGANCVKVFPVQSLGGVNYIKSLQAPLSNIPMIPTGGITLANAHQFIKAGAIAVGLSTELFPQDLIKARKWDAISQLAKDLNQQINQIP
jgi:2-dehydro-3-deoxyphosphogluconate aldolase / (4S)-4-hydroxy-2-oxoglutarate aldolase